MLVTDRYNASYWINGSDPVFDLAATDGHSRLTNEERQTLLELKSALLFPLKTKDSMPGIVALRSRLGDVPFSGEDKRLLQLVGASASLAVENAQLVEQMIAEAHRRQEIEAENEQRAGVGRGAPVATFNAADKHAAIATRRDRGVDDDFGGEPPQPGAFHFEWGKRFMRRSLFLSESFSYNQKRLKMKSDF